MSFDAEGGGWRRGTAAWIAAWLRAYPFRAQPLLDAMEVPFDVSKLRSPHAIYRAMKIAQMLRDKGRVREACRRAERWSGR